MLTYRGCEVCRCVENPPTWFPVYEFGVKCCTQCFYTNTVPADAVSDDQKAYSRWPPTQTAYLFWRGYLRSTKGQRSASEECERLRKDMVDFAEAMQKRDRRRKKKRIERASRRLQFDTVRPCVSLS